MALTTACRYVASFETDEGEQRVIAKSVVSTAPAHALKDVLTPLMPDASEIFDKIRDEIKRRGIHYPPVAAVTVAYPKASFKDIELPNDFGNLQNVRWHS